MYNNLATLAIFAFAFSAIAGRVERGWVTGPIIYIFFGLIAGPVGLGFIDLNVDAVELRVIADLTLALVLFIDAANADLKNPANPCHYPPAYVVARLADLYSPRRICGHAGVSRCVPA
jgi:NhaP-type Na+/H+ or K+/H+ antiporter